MQRRDRLAFVVFSTWATLGLYLDGWAHHQDKPETFFTPWHGLLYSGVAAAFAWSALERRRRAPSADDYGFDGLAKLGGLAFLAGGVGDMVWHTLLGIEVGIEALVSPTHLLLMIGGLLAATAPLRAGASVDGSDAEDSWVRAASTTIAVCLAAFFLQFLSAFKIDGEVMAAADAANETQERLQALGVASLLVTAAMLAFGAVLILRRRHRAGQVTVLFTAVALTSLGLESFEQLPLLAAAIVGGAVVDAVTLRTRRVAAAVAVGSAAFVAVWSVAATLALDLAWPAEITSGSAVLAALGGLAVAKLGAGPSPAVADVPDVVPASFAGTPTPTPSAQP